MILDCKISYFQYFYHLSLKENFPSIQDFFSPIILYINIYFLIYRNILKLSNLIPVSRINILTVCFIWWQKIYMVHIINLRSLYGWWNYQTRITIALRRSEINGNLMEHYSYFLCEERIKWNINLRSIPFLPKIGENIS